MLYGLGAATAAVMGHAISCRRYALGQLAVTALQLMTHYSNDYFDYDADRANTTPTAWSGGSRVLVNDELPRATALIAAVILAGAGIVVALLLATSPGSGWLVTPTLGVILVLSWGYSAPPLRICASGLGELDTAVVVTGLVPWLAFYLQSTDLRGIGVLATAIIPLACLQFAMLLAIEVPDAGGDRATGKRTLVVRLGATMSMQLYVAVVGLAYIGLVIGAMIALPSRVALAGMATCPIAIWRIARRNEYREPATWERLGFWSVAMLVGTAIAELLAMLSLV